MTFNFPDNPHFLEILFLIPCAKNNVRKDVEMFSKSFENVLSNVWDTLFNSSFQFDYWSSIKKVTSAWFICYVLFFLFFFSLSVCDSYFLTRFVFGCVLFLIQTWKSYLINIMFISFINKILRKKFFILLWKFYDSIGWKGPSALACLIISALSYFIPPTFQYIYLLF